MVSYPKPDSDRRNRNPHAFGWTDLPKAGCKGKPPALPAIKPTWHAETRRWWATLWAMPQATIWARDDSELFRLALLHEHVWHRSPAPSATLLAEMRQIEDRHGLNPKAMLQLRWRIVDDAAGVAAKPIRKASADRRARLSAVK